MKKLLKILAYLVVLLLALFIAGYLFAVIKGKSIITAKAEELLGREITIERVSLRFPASVVIRELEIEDFLRLRRLSISPSLLALLSGRLILNEVNLISPELSIERLPDGKLNLPKPKRKEKEKIEVAAEKKDKKGMFLLSRLSIKEASIDFLDRRVDPIGVALKVRDLTANVKGISLLPSPLRTRFNIEASVLNGKTEASLLGKGWIDFLNKDMEADFALKGMDLVYLRPYYRRFTLSKVESGNLNFTADLTAEDNDLTAKCQIELEGLSFKKAEEGEILIDPLAAILGTEGDEPKNVVFDFEIKTKLDNPKVDITSITGSVIAKAIEKSLKEVVPPRPQEFIEGPEDVKEKIKEWGEELEERFKGIFKK